MNARDTEPTTYATHRNGVLCMSATSRLLWAALALLLLWATIDWAMA